MDARRGRAHGAVRTASRARKPNVRRLSTLKTFTAIALILELRACGATFGLPKSSIIREQFWDIEGLSRDARANPVDKDECLDNACSDNDSNTAVGGSDFENKQAVEDYVKSEQVLIKDSDNIYKRRTPRKYNKNVHRKRRQISKKEKSSFDDVLEDDSYIYFDENFPIKGPKSAGNADVLNDEDYYNDEDNSIKGHMKNTSPKEDLITEENNIEENIDVAEPQDDVRSITENILSAQFLNMHNSKKSNNNMVTTAMPLSQEYNSQVEETVKDPMMLMQEQENFNKERMKDAEDEEEYMAVVPKCCPMGQNMSQSVINGSRPCAPSLLSFQPLFFDFNGTFMWEYDNNVWETIVGNPCLYDKYRLDPQRDSKDEFYLLTNGSLLAPFHNPRMLGPREYCMETFWDESSPGGLVMPLVCFPTPPTDEASTPSTFVAYAVGLIISVPFLLATATVYLLIPELRNNHGMALACHALCLACAFSCLAATQLAGHTLPDQICHVVAFVIQFSFLACFFWLNVLCFDTWLIVSKYLTKGVSTRRERKRFLWYSIYAWLMPLVLLGITMLMDLTPMVPASFIKPNFGASGCWFQTDKAAFPYFYGPVAVIIASNIVLFIMTSRAFAKQHELLNQLTVADLTRPDYGNSEDWMRLNEALDANSAGGATTDTSPQESPVTNKPLEFKHRWRKYKKIFRMCCFLSVVMGLSWALEIVSWAAGGPAVVWSVFDVINALQGVIIFAIFVLQKGVRELVWRKIKEKISCRSWNNDSELEVVSERTVITTFQASTNNGRKRDYV